MVELYDILTLENNKDYTIADIVVNNNVTYCLLIEIDKEENLLDNSLIAKIIEEDKELSVIPVTNEEEIKTISNLFLKNN